MSRKLQATSAAVVRHKSGALTASGPLPDRTAEEARLAFVAQRGVPLARIGLIANLAFTAGTTR